jgi:hypothetical protein
MLKAVRFILLSVFALAPPLAWGQAGTGIGGTAHDFSGIGAAVPTGLCTFCHTPHQAQSQALLWNHTLSTNTFSWTDTATTAGTTYPTFAGDTYQGATAKCLSCHDGSVAVGDIGWWLGGDPGILLNVTHGAGDPFNVGLGGNMNGNHPVAMPIPFNNVGSTYNTVSTGAGIVLLEWKADPTANGIRLFNDNGTTISAGPVAGQTGIECSSCHDPHNGPQVQDQFFLRGLVGGNTADYICIKCHTK